MATRIAGVTLPSNKRIEVALTYIYGIGRTLSNKVLKIAQVDPNKSSDKLTGDEVAKIKDIIEKEHRVEGDLKREVVANIKRLKEVGSYRGSRHVRILPARGQRTKTNSRTIRGNVRKTMGSGRKAAAEKT
ncbi:30S ribosomal protein S13 [Patescibacteria group bacterium]